MLKEAENAVVTNDKTGFLAQRRDLIKTGLHSAKSHEIDLFLTTI